MRILDFRLTHPSYSADFCGPYFRFENDSGKVIKYVHFTVTPVNAVNDVVSCTITGRSQESIKYTGPLATGPLGRDRIAETQLDTLWHNHTIKNCYLNSVTIEYMDGTKEEHTENVGNLIRPVSASEVLPVIGKSILWGTILLILFLLIILPLVL